MADAADLILGKFCRDHQETIEKLTKGLDPVRRQQAIDWLNECAEKAKETEDDKIGFMRRELHPTVQRIRFMTGERMRIG